MGLFWFLLINLAALLAGNAFLKLLFRIFRVSPELNFSRIFQAGLSAALGFGLLGYAVLFAGLAGVLTPAVLMLEVIVFLVLGVLFLCHCLPCRQAGEKARRADEAISQLSSPHCESMSSRDADQSSSLHASGRDPGLKSAGMTNWVSYLWLGFIAWAIFCGICDVLSPEILGDSLCYHLNLPKVFLKQHSSAFSFYDYNGLYPILMEMLYTLGLGLHSQELAKAMHLSLGLAGTGMLYGIVKRELNREYGLLAAAIFLLTPAVLNQLGTHYVDVGLAVFTLGAFCAVYFWQEQRKTIWVILAGIFLGLCLSVKTLGAISAIAAGLMILFYFPVRKSKGSRDSQDRHCEEARRADDAISQLSRGEGIASPLARLPAGKAGNDRFGNNLRAVLLCAAAALLFSFIWYARAYIHLGNPVFPYLNKLFGLPVTGAGLLNYNDAALLGMGKNVFAYLCLLVNLTLFPQRFEGLGAQIGPVFLAFVPAAFLSIKEKRFVRQTFLFTWIFLTLWFFLPQRSRFMIPALSLMSALAAFGIYELRQAGSVWQKRLPLVLVVILLGLNSLLGLYNNREILKILSGQESRESYLRRTVRSYAVSQWMNQNLPLNAKILNAEEVQGYYLARDSVRESFYALLTDYAEKYPDPQAWVGHLKQAGFTHVLYLPGEKHTDGGLRTALQDNGFVSRHFDVLYETEFLDTNTGKVLRYQVLALNTHNNELRMT